MSASQAETNLQLILDAAARTPCVGSQDPANVAAWILGAARRMTELAAEVERQKQVWLRGCDCAPEDACRLARERDDLRRLVRSLFDDYLDQVEEGDSGREFRPISIGCCRAAKVEPLYELLKELRVAVGLPAEAPKLERRTS